MNKPAGVNPHPTSAKNPTGKGGLWHRLTLAAIIGLLLVTSLTGCVSKAPHEQFIAALKMVDELDYQEYESKMSIRFQSDYPEDQKLYEIFNQVSFAVTTKLDKEDRRFLLDLDLLYKR